MNEEFELDYVIDEFILATLPDITYRRIVNIIKTLDLLNNINKRYVDIANIIETDVLEVIQNDAITEDDKIPVVKARFIERFTKALLIHGIKVDEEITLLEIEIIVNALNNIYNLELNQHQIILDEIEKDDEDGIVHKLAIMISDISNVRPIDMFELILDVDEELFEDFKERFKEIAMQEDKLEDTVVEEFEIFLTASDLFAETITYKTSIEIGEFYNLIDEDMIYTVLEMYKEKADLIPHEVILSLYAKHRNIDAVMDEIDSINLENISYLEEQHKTIDDLNKVMLMLMNKIKGQ